MKRIKNTLNQGLSLVELIIYMGLSFILLVVISSLFFAVLDVQIESQNVAVVEQDGRFIMARLYYDIYRAQDILVPTNIGDQTSQLQLFIDGETYTYQIINDKLSLVTAIETGSLNSSENQTTNFTVKRVGNVGGKSSVDISLDLESPPQIDIGPQTKSYQAILSVR